MPSKASITDLFTSADAKLIGVSKQASDILIANLTAGTLPMCVGAPVENLASDDVTIIQFFVDASPSMSCVRDLLIETINEIMIDGLKGASKKTANSIVMAMIAFSTNIWPLFDGGFADLANIQKLKRSDYNPDKGNLTNLFGAMMQSIAAATAYATQILQTNGTPPKVICCGLTDGGDNVGQATRADILALTSTLSGELYHFPLAVFETYDTVNDKQLAKDTGFEVFKFKKEASETDDDIRRRFRHMIGTMSSSMIATSTAKIGTSKSSFWTPGN